MFQNSTIEVFDIAYAYCTHYTDAAILSVFNHHINRNLFFDYSGKHDNVQQLRKINN